MSLHDITIIPLAKAAGIMADADFDVLSLTASDCASVRTLTSVDVKHEYGQNWLVVRWSRTNKRTPWGTADCGFAGWVIDDELRHVLRARSQS